MSACLDYECPDCVGGQCVAGGCEKRGVEIVARGGRKPRIIRENELPTNEAERMEEYGDDDGE